MSIPMDLHPHTHIMQGSVSLRNDAPSTSTHTSVLVFQVRMGTNETLSYELIYPNHITWLQSIMYLKVLYYAHLRIAKLLLLP